MQLNDTVSPWVPAAGELPAGSVLDRMVDGVAILDAEGMITAFNPAAGRLFGYHATQLLGQHVSMLIPGLSGQPQDPYSAEPHALVTGSREIEGRRGDGSGFPVDFSLSELSVRDARMYIAVFHDLTPQRQALEMLRVYQRIVSSSRDFMSLVDRSYTYRIVNNACLAMLNRKREEMLGRTLAGIWGEECFRGHLRQPFDQALGGQPGRHEAWFDLPMRGRRYLVVDYTPYRDGDGTITGVVVCARDITRRQQDEQAITESEARFRSLVDATPIMIWVADADMRFTYFNRTWLQFTGRTLQEEVRYSWESDAHPGDLQRCVTEYRAAFVGHRPYSIEFRQRRHDGAWRWILDTGQPRYSPDGAFCGYIGSCLDITERKEAEERLRANENRLRTIINTEPECVKVVAADGALLEMNAAGLAMLDAGSLEEAQEKGLLEFIIPEHRAAFAQLHARCMRGETGMLEFEIVSLNGVHRWLETHAAPLCDETERPVAVLGITLNITERKRANSLLLGQNAVLQMVAVGLPLEKTLNMLLRVIETLEPDMLTSILLLDSDGRHLRHLAAPSLPRAYTQAIDGVAIGPNVGSCGTAAFRRQAVIVTDIDTDPLWADYRSLAAAHGLRACWSTPLLDAAGEVLGTFAVYYRRPCAPETHHQHLIAFTTQTATTALESRRREQDLSESRQRLELLSHRLIALQEEERGMLARELHDEIGQVLTAVKLSLETLRRRAGTAPRAPRIADCVDLVENAIRQVRNRSLNLRPSMLDDLGLIPTLRWYIEQFGVAEDCAIELDAEPLAVRPAPVVEITCYRVVQEAITNARRHAGARHVRVQIAVQGDRLHFAIRDDGAGFDLQTARQRGLAGESFGLSGMEERAVLAGGSLEILTAPGSGTEIRASVPLGGVDPAHDFGDEKAAGDEDGMRP